MTLFAGALSLLAVLVSALVACRRAVHALHMRLTPDCELIVLPGAGHFPYVDQTHKFNMMALRFLRDEDAP